MDDKVVRLDVTFKGHSDGEKLLIHKNSYACKHGPYVIDEALAEVTCEPCGAKMNPIHVLKILANHENRWHQNAENAKAEMERLEQRTRTKCQHCHQMTRISRS